MRSLPSLSPNLAIWQYRVGTNLDAIRWKNYSASQQQQIEHHYTQGALTCDGFFALDFRALKQTAPEECDIRRICRRDLVYKVIRHAQAESLKQNLLDKREDSLTADDLVLLGVVDTDRFEHWASLRRSLLIKDPTAAGTYSIARSLLVLSRAPESAFPLVVDGRVYKSGKELMHHATKLDPKEVLGGWRDEVDLANRKKRCYAEACYIGGASAIDTIPDLIDNIEHEADRLPLLLECTRQVYRAAMSNLQDIRTMITYKKDCQVAGWRRIQGQAYRNNLMEGFTLAMRRLADVAPAHGVLLYPGVFMRPHELRHEADRFGGQAVAHRVYLVRGTDAGKKAWYYCLVTKSVLDFKAALDDDVIHLENHGEIIYSAYGDEPPVSTTELLKRRYKLVGGDITKGLTHLEGLLKDIPLYPRPKAKSAMECLQILFESPFQALELEPPGELDLAILLNDAENHAAKLRVRGWEQRSEPFLSWKVAIYMYTCEQPYPVYRVLNTPFNTRARSKELMKSALPYMALLKQALHQLPSEMKYTGTLFRGMDVSKSPLLQEYMDNRADVFQPKRIMSFAAFTSASVCRDVAHRFSKGILLEIAGCTGYYKLGSLSRYGNEEEVLLEPPPAAQYLGCVVV
eukprot:m.237592 g.237592  ORF g.237592 m.237592 type:complete len:630 (+) comp17420_c0_seq12:277-2166(+)